MYNANAATFTANKALELETSNRLIAAQAIFDHIGEQIRTRAEQGRYSYTIDTATYLDLMAIVPWDYIEQTIKEEGYTMIGLDICWGA